MMQSRPSWPGTLEVGVRFDRHVDRVEHISDATRQRLLISGLVLGGLHVRCGNRCRVDPLGSYRIPEPGSGHPFQFCGGRSHPGLGREATQVLMTQWLGTASALSRIVWRPLGEVTEVGHRDAAAMQADAELLKLQVAELRLTARRRDPACPPSFTDGSAWLAH